MHVHKSRVRSTIYLPFTCSPLFACRLPLTLAISFPLPPYQAASEVVAFARSDLDAARTPAEIAAARDFLHTALTRERVAKKRVTVMVGRRILKAATARVRAAEQEVNAANNAEEKRAAAQLLEAARDELVSAEHTVSVSAGQQLIHAARQRVADLRYVCSSRKSFFSVLVNRQYHCRPS